MKIWAAGKSDHWLTWSLATIGPERILAVTVDLGRSRVIQVRRRQRRDLDEVERKFAALVVERGLAQRAVIAHMLAQIRHHASAQRRRLEFPLGDFDQRCPVPAREQMTAIDDAHILVAAHAGDVTPFLDRESLRFLVEERSKVENSVSGPDHRCHGKIAEDETGGPSPQISDLPR